jgi:hypothetical protein
MAIVAVIAWVVPHAGIGGGAQHEVGHWFGIYFPSEGPTHLHLEALLVDVDGSVVATGAWLRTDDASFKILKCIEVVDTREGETVAYAAFGPAGSQTGETDFAFIQVRLEDGVTTEADLGYSETRTSTNQCGAASIAVRKIDAFVVKQKVTL